MPCIYSVFSIEPPAAAMGGGSERGHPAPRQRTRVLCTPYVAAYGNYPFLGHYYITQTGIVIPFVGQQLDRVLLRALLDRGQS